jgi:hypothetical protein
MLSNVIELEILNVQKLSNNVSVAGVRAYKVTSKIFLVIFETSNGFFIQDS